jgi:hypothetical protein
MNQHYPHRERLRRGLGTIPTTTKRGNNGRMMMTMMMNTMSFLVMVLSVLFVIVCTNTLPSNFCFVEGFMKPSLGNTFPLPVPVSSTFSNNHGTTVTRYSRLIGGGSPPPSSSLSSSTRLNAIGGIASRVVSATFRGGGGAATRNMALVASGGPGGVADIVVSAYDWCINLGNPSALVAGAVVATLYENMNSGILDVNMKNDTKLVRFGKRLTRVLLLSAFALEVISIFVTTVTGTVLLSRTLDFMDDVVPIGAYTTPLQFLRENFEFEFLTARLTFLQGLMNWLAAIGIGHLVPHYNSDTEVDDTGDGRSRHPTLVGRAMNKFIGCAMFSCISVMVAFYNTHMEYYQNIGHMWLRWGQLLFQKYVFKFPILPMLFVYVPCIAATVYFGIQAFLDGNDDSTVGQQESQQ